MTSIYTTKDILHYYRVQPCYVCTHCEATYHAPVLEEIHVALPRGESVTLKEYKRRLSLLYQKPPEDIQVPLRKLKIRKATTTVLDCGCMAEETYGSPFSPYPGVLPAPITEAYGSIESPNVDLIGGPRKPTSKKIKRETPEERARREKLRAVERGGLDSLLDF